MMKMMMMMMMVMMMLDIDKLSVWLVII